MKRFWFKFEFDSKLPNRVGLGIGVTAYNYEDALKLIKEKIFPYKEIPKIKQVTENIDISTLDANHVLPNIGIVIYRGIWFPLGYNYL